jgi:hypothetical protein
MFGCRDARQQRRLFARLNQSLRRDPTPTGFAEIVSDDFPVLHFGGAWTAFNPA